MLSLMVIDFGCVRMVYIYEWRLCGMCDVVDKHNSLSAHKLMS